MSDTTTDHMTDPMDGPKIDNLTDPMTDPVTDLLSISMTPQNYQLSIFGLEYIQSLMWRHFEEKIREGPEGCLVKSARSSHLQLGLGRAITERLFDRRGKGQPCSKIRISIVLEREREREREYKDLSPEF